ncbi:MAG: hypothetical protein JNM39_15880 [Bdellovibrionaceae bacterium]|nr:hypothetical protein [Pseudobdellovibrionaceae bacterium]
MKQYFGIIGLLPLVLFFSLHSKAANPPGLSDSDYVRYARLYLENRPEEQQFQQENALTLKDIRVQPTSLTGTLVNKILSTSDRIKRVDIEMVTSDEVSFIYSCDLDIVFNGTIDLQDITLSNCTGPENSGNLP